jgi:hypothetical protein
VSALARKATSTSPREPYLAGDIRPWMGGFRSGRFRQETSTIASTPLVLPRDNRRREGDKYGQDLLVGLRAGVSEGHDLEGTKADGGRGWVGPGLADVQWALQ